MTLQCPEPPSWPVGGSQTGRGNCETAPVYSYFYCDAEPGERFCGQLKSHWTAILIGPMGKFRQSPSLNKPPKSSHPDIDDAAAILHEFLSTLILSVQKEIDGELKDVMKKDHKAACADAAIQAHETVTPSKPSPADPYSHPAGVDVHAAAAAHTALDEVDRRSRYADEDHRCTPS
ncbi:hypothetical protein B0H10DRAFT_1956702 [Mycena sp. CBHHK59/15]|nr:hypothetical protein B0H10DRAFT_1956702 [Mycena sp. CBHHK59/15]